MANYVPRKGDFISLTFDPQSGHEQKGRRPALVISNYLFNKATNLVIVCPLTSTDRRIPFHLVVPAGAKVSGFVMVEQVKSVDYVARKAKFIQKAPSEIIEDALSILDACLK
jgi:mRNA interferase MazF